MRIGAFLLLGFALALPALAQAPAPTDSVTVTGTPQQQAIARYIEASVTPTRMTGKMARWETPICPAVQGVEADAAGAIIARIKDVAGQVGVRVNGRKDCDPNIEIIFTDYPQAVMDQVKTDKPDMLGYYDSVEERDRLATVTRPIQAWYRTATQDLRGHVSIDGARTTESGRGVTAVLPCAMTGGNKQVVVRNGVAAFMGVGTCTVDYAYATKNNITGFRIDDGVRSQFDHVAIIADSALLARHKADAVGDYITLLALAQLSSLDRCQSLPSIVNILGPGCAEKPGALTPTDLSYLGGIYRMNPTLSPQALKNQVAEQMVKAAGTQ
jgi:hypothetical protein